jgi:mRNA interferase HicA
MVDLRVFWVDVATSSGTGFGKLTRVTSGVNLPAIGSHYVSVAETQQLLTVYTYLCTVKSMKRRDLERALRQLGWYFLRHGGKHDVWTDGKREEAIPRHTEIHDKLAQAILRRVKGSA